MVRKIFYLPALCMLVAVFTMMGCSDDILKNIEEEIMEEVADEEPSLMTMTVGLPGDDIETRLSYQEVIYGGGLGMKSKWQEDDKILLTLSAGNPGTPGYSSTLALTSGAGTSTGVFTGNAIYYISEKWFVYYPAEVNGFQAEKGFLSLSYDDQVQKGNGNMNHIKDYHTIRYIYTASPAVQLTGSDIDLSGEDLEQSGCIKFNLSNLPSIVPVKVSLEYYNIQGNPQGIFYKYNFLNSYYYDEGRTYTPNGERSYKMDLGLENFSATTSIAAYMMTSNASITIDAGSTLRVVVTDSDGNKYFCDKSISSQLVLAGGTLNRISCSSWTTVPASLYDGIIDPVNGVKVLQEKSKGNGVDIIIMGDGYAGTEANFGVGGKYHNDVNQAYEDFFGVEPYASLKDYFNVYYINAVSKDNHDASPLENGAIQGSAMTVFNTQFVQNSTHISGNDALALEYAIEAMKAKGGVGGTACSESDAGTRANKALIMVMVNVPCHAGTCYMRWSNGCDYGNAYSVAYTALNKTDFKRKWTLLHEAGGHGFGKLADEYVAYSYTQFDTRLWKNLDDQHSLGIYRNVDKYWNESYSSIPTVYCPEIPEAEVVPTTDGNVYWSALVADYKASEGLGVWESAHTYTNFFCRATGNSVMNSQFAANGQFFNAISRWAIWYRTMKLAGVDVGADFMASIVPFKTFDATLTITKNVSSSAPAMANTWSLPLEEIQPLAPPVLIGGHWENGRFVEE